MPQLMELRGVAKLKRELKSLSRFQPKVNRALQRKQKSMLSDARSIVQRVVYSQPENPDFPRSGNTLAATSVDTENMSDNVTRTRIMLDPAMASRAFSYSNTYKGLSSYYALSGKPGFEFYPSYVRQGIFFRKSGAKRDFKQEWNNQMKPEFISVVGRAVRAFKK